MSPGNPTPTVRLWLLRLQYGPGFAPVPEATWRELSFTTEDVEGGTLAELWTGQFRGWAAAAPERARPASKWYAQFHPSPGHPTGIGVNVYWAGPR